MSRLDSEVVVIGGGPSGLSAALTLGRSRRRVVVIDGGEPRNAPATSAHGLLGHEGISPFDLLRRGRDEVAVYGGEIIRGHVIDARTDGEVFRIRTTHDEEVSARAVLIATGAYDQLPEIPGLRERWGRDVIHCPYCHGWEVRGQRIGVLAVGPMSALQALMFTQWSSDVHFFPQGREYDDEDLAKLGAVGIRIDPRRVTDVETHDDRLAGVRLDDGSAIDLDALVVPTLTQPRLEGLEGLGLHVSHSAAGTALAVDPAGRTNVPGVWAAGNVVNPAMQISESAANGARVAMTVNTDLIFHDAERAAHKTENNR